MTNCRECGKENRSEARFCRFCGQLLVLVDAASESEHLSVASQEGEPVGSDHKPAVSDQHSEDIVFDSEEPRAPVESGTELVLDDQLVVASGQPEVAGAAESDEESIPVETKGKLIVDDQLVSISDLPEDEIVADQRESSVSARGENGSIVDDRLGTVEAQPERDGVIGLDETIPLVETNGEPAINALPVVTGDQPLMQDVPDLGEADMPVEVEAELLVDVQPVVTADRSEELDIPDFGEADTPVELEAEPAVDVQSIVTGDRPEMPIDHGEGGVPVEPETERTIDDQPIDTGDQLAAASVQLEDDDISDRDETDAGLESEDEPIEEDEEIATDVSSDEQAQTALSVEPALTESKVEPADDSQPEVEGDSTLEIGTVLQERFKILRIISQETGTSLYEAEDRQRCWNCQAVQSGLEARFCEVCGAEMVPPALVHLHARRVGAGDQPPDAEEWFTEAGFIFQVEMPAAEVEEEGKPLNLQLVAGYQTDTGLERNINEDSVLVLQLVGLCETKNAPALGLFAVADGMGGHDAGEVASRTAIHSMAANVMEQIYIPEVSGNPLPMDALNLQLQEAVLSANQAILDLRSLSPTASNMGCTLTAVLARNEEAIVVNVGDSRVYRMRAGMLTQVTRDHSMVAKLIEQGLLQPDAVYTHEQKGVIYRSLGDRSNLEVETFSLELEEGDRLLLCSDGLWDMVRDPFIEDVLLQFFDPQQACEQLVENANLAGGEDNISVIVIDVQSQV